MINKYQFFNSASTLTTVANIFISGDIGLSFSADTNIIDIYQSFGHYDFTGKIYEFFPYNGLNFNKRNYDDNNFVFLYSANTVTGYTIIQGLYHQYSSDEKNTFADNLAIKITNQDPNLKFGVVFEDVPEQDNYVNISLERSIDLIETLTIKNNVVGQWNQLDSPTGVVFGTLIANQKINDSNGNPIKIPLRNVPILIHNKQNASVATINPSNDNSRTAVNMVNNSKRDYYTNDFSWNFDKSILPTISTKNVTDVYKYSTITNENGEFIITDVPTGIQTMILEIDLLKQGLTPEEVELNVSPYPKTQNLTPDQVPHLIYREVPIQVLPSWGTINTGYTRVDMNLNIDLRKWSTFFVPPVTIYKDTYDKILQAGILPSLNIRVKDMANTGINGRLYPSDNIECVVIPDITQRDKSRFIGWFNETRQLRSLITFNQLSFNAFKLPANIYDPNSYKTDGSGNTTSDKGVWLSSYQFKVFFNDENNFYRVSGFNTGETSTFNLNNNFVSTTGVTIGVFHYEKPWSTDYPTRYSIPQLPNQLNQNKAYDNFSGHTPTGASLNMLVPKYTDGDRLGATTIFNGYIFGGWGAQRSDAQDIYPNYFAQQVATSDLYRYEPAILTYDEFSNGYMPNYNYGGVAVNQSNVKGGELYQRVECGHAYFMWLQGYPRVTNNKDYDELYTPDFKNNATVPGISPYYSYSGNNYLFYSDTLLATDFIPTPNFNKGYIYLYKIVNPDPTTLVPPQPPLTKRFVNLNFQNIYMQRGGKDEKARAVINTNDRNHRFKFRYFNEESHETTDAAVLRIKNNGIVTSTITVGSDTIDIAPNGGSYDFNLLDVANQNVIQLPTNDNFDFAANTYYTTNYEMSVHNLNFYFPNGNLSEKIVDYPTGYQGYAPRYNIGVNDGTNYYSNIYLSGNTLLSGVNTYYLVTKANEIRVRGIAGKPKANGLIIDCSAEGDFNGLLLISSQITYLESCEFRLNQISIQTSNSEDIPAGNINPN